MDFNVIAGYFMKGDMPSAIAYLKECGGFEEDVKKYEDIFINENYIKYDVADVINDILTIYQRYYRNVFYLLEAEETAAKKLLAELSDYLKLGSQDEETIRKALMDVFESNGIHILTGMTNGHFGPYVWKETKKTNYEVELPNSTREFIVNILDGFIMRSWMDYLTFGMFGAGGWTDLDGTINCIKMAYDFDSESFKVSLLKHEAQHSLDFERYADKIIPSELEYRAKLIELIYSTDIALLSKFIREADPSMINDSHKVASGWIAEKMADLENGNIEDVQSRARMLLNESDKQMDEKYL